MVGMFDGVAGFELNISCPNTTEMIGDDPVLVGHAVKAAKRATDLPVFVKVGYGMDTAVAAAVSAGADGVTAINTVPGLDMARSGGLSGPPLLPMALWMIRRISSKYDIPIIGCGGISAGKDAAHHMEMGASAVQIGTAVDARAALSWGMLHHIWHGGPPYGLCVQSDSTTRQYVPPVVSLVHHTDCASNQH